MDWTTYFKFCFLYIFWSYNSLFENHNTKWQCEEKMTYFILCSVLLFFVVLNCAQFLFGFASNVAKLLQSQTMNIPKAPTGIKLSMTQFSSTVYSLKHRKWLTIAEQLSKFRGDANNKPTEKTMKDTLKISTVILFSYHTILFPNLKAGFTK